MITRRSCSRRSWFVAFVCVIAALTLPDVSAAAQSEMSRLERGRIKQMLKNIGDELKKTYYDPTFGGRDLDAHFKKADERLDQVVSLGQALAVVAQALVDLDDSHTFFIPPNRTARVDYGWRIQMIGDQCYVTSVAPSSDAAAKGLRAGDQVLSIDRFKPSRSELWKLQYNYNMLNPRTGVDLVVKSPDGATRTVNAASKVTRSKRVLDLTGADGGADLEALIREMEDAAREHGQQRLGSTVIWRMPNFEFENHDDVMKWALEDAETLILDLRGNPGGYVKTLEHVAGRFFDADLTIAELKGRKKMSPMRVRKSGRPFTGRIVALIDSRTSSAAETFARLLQLQKRGVVIGDRSAGSVMQSVGFNGEIGADRVVFYGASITNANVIMSDGKSLERVGVVPDELIVPTAEDLAAGRDPVLARAAALVGIQLDATQAGQLFTEERK